MWWLPKSPKLLSIEIFKLIIIHCTWCITHIYSVYALTPTIQCGNFNEELHRDCDDAIFVLQSNQFTCLLMVCNILWLYRLEINRFSCVYRYCGILVKHSYETHKKSIAFIEISEVEYHFLTFIKFLLQDHRS